MFSRIFIIGCLASSLQALASYESAEKSYNGTPSRKTIIELVNGGYYFSVIPWIKENMARGSSVESDVDQAIDTVVNSSGIKAFESLPEDILRRSRSVSVKYILAKRHLSKGKYSEALNDLARIPADHSAYPFVANLRGTIYSTQGNHAEAELQFKDCVRESSRRIGKARNMSQKEQFVMNRDYCSAGIARAQFASGEYKKAEYNYLDIPKESFVWPEILFEEAWTSYYVKNYNRTLGKLVSYKAPVFDFIFKPEIEVLKALTYMKMCLYDDAKKTVDDFYSDLMNPAKELRSLLLTRGRDYRYYYNLMSDHESSKGSHLRIVDSILKSIKKESAYIEMKTALTEALAEFARLKQHRSSGFKGSLSRNLQTVVDEYRNSLGAYVRNGLLTKYAELYGAFQGMSYIKLEVLAQRKERLYQSDTIPGQKRGDVKYIERNDKQYFWTFNGEFWADELGDYVFALRSEC